ncbi:hypothetical protein [Luteibacter aegosomatissinici]|uniref:hypothetical protein n=1 Tax=Luteibacter aegosomatissinici TaxID=2911539 RepID=UPI001FFB3193|nr:hypothetical protein [Luteibacter aegosomatissinici]UPG92682.1 hypothetical protein L2Y97_12480 [Luteibacter aegosomatissinici]
MNDELPGVSIGFALDRTRRCVRIEQAGDRPGHDVPFGQVLVTVSVRTVRGTKFARVIVSQWPAAHGKHLSPADAQQQVRALVSADVSPRFARDIKAWLRLHPFVTPDEVAFKRAWKAEVASLVRECRDQRLVTDPPAVELIDVQSGPTIAYLVIEEDGRVYGAVGGEPNLERVVDPLMSDGCREVKAVVGDYAPAWTLTDHQFERLDAMRQAGLIGLVNRHPG